MDDFELNKQEMAFFDNAAEKERFLSSKRRRGKTTTGVPKKTMPTPIAKAPAQKKASTKKTITKKKEKAKEATTSKKPAKVAETLCGRLNIAEDSVAYTVV